MRVRSGLVFIAMALFGTQFGIGGCLEPARDRAMLDLHPVAGHAGSVQFNMDQQLAVVEHNDEGSLRLFAQVPKLTLSLQVGTEAPLDWTLTVNNCMPNALLSTTPPVDIVPQQTDWATSRSWKIGLSANQSVQLVIEPAPTPLDEFRFALLSDIQDAVGDVDDIFERINSDDQIHFVLSTGDLTEEGERHQFERFKQALLALDVPFYSTIGNHDTGFDAGPNLWPVFFGRHSYHFEYEQVAFSMLDSASATIDPTVYDRLAAWLTQAHDKTHVVVTHVPAIDPIGVRNGSFRSRREAAKLLSRLAQAKVDLTLYGHVHSYYAYSNAGIPAYISGGGGAIPETMDGVGRHYLSVDISASGGVRQVSLVRVD